MFLRLYEGSGVAALDHCSIPRHWLVLTFQGEEDSVAGFPLGILSCLATPNDMQARHDEAPVV